MKMGENSRGVDKKLHVNNRPNFGSVDGSSAAAARYTEARLSKLAEWLFFDDLNNGAAVMIPNYDNEGEEPKYLPSKLPIHFINGVSNGIGVGFKSGLPPHNPTEVVNLLKALLTNIISEEVNTVDIIPQYLTGPDFPTEGEISTPAAIAGLYTTGYAQLYMRSSVEIIDAVNGRSGDTLVFTGIPDSTNTEQILNSIIEAVKPAKIKRGGKEVDAPPKITDIKAVRDESSLNTKTKITIPKIVVELKNTANTAVTITKLYKYTNLQKDISYFTHCIDRYGKIVESATYLDLFNVWYEDRIQQIRRRTTYHLNKVSDRIHTIEGLLVALANIDKVIKIVRSAKDDKEAVDKLLKGFEGQLFTKQAEEIIKMRISRLTKMNSDNLTTELETLNVKYREYIEILKSKSVITSIILTEIEEFEKMIGTVPRRTTVTVFDAGDVEELDLVEKEDLVVSLDDNGFLRRHNKSFFKVQQRGGKGKNTNIEGIIKTINTSTHDSIIITTDSGNIIRTTTLDIPDKPRGTHARSLGVPAEEDQVPVSIATLGRDIEKDKNMFFCMIADNGKVKRIKASDTVSKMRNDLICFKSVADESIIKSFYADKTSQIFIATYDGMGVMLNTDDIRVSQRNSGGSPGMVVSTKNFSDNAISDATAVNNPETDHIFIITVNGFGKRIKASNFPPTKPNTKGRIAQKLHDEQIVIGVATVEEEDVINIFTTKGKLISVNAKDVRVVQRDTYGTRMIDLDEDDMISSIAVL